MLKIILSNKILITSLSKIFFSDLKKLISFFSLDVFLSELNNES